MDKPHEYSVEHEDERPWPYLSKMVQYAGVSKDYKMCHLIKKKKKKHAEA